jgi:hypothetical protein
LIRCQRTIIASLAALLLAVSPSRAEPLDKAACDALHAEAATLAAAGLKADMEKGPEWAKANLPEDRMKQIQRYIEVEEGLAFRCRKIAIPVKKKATGKPAAAKPGEATDGSAGPPADTAAASPTGSLSPAATEAPVKPAVTRLQPAKPARSKSATQAPAVQKPAPAGTKPRRVVARPKAGAPASPQKPGLFSLD